MNDPLKRGVFKDPERSADWIGSRLLIYPQEDRNLRGSPTSYDVHVAQLAEALP
jgi:hypothetical protein